MSWSYVGGVTTGNVNSGTTGTISLPAGTNGGDLIVVSCCFYNTTFTQASFTMQQDTAGSQGAKDAFWMGTRVAGGAAGSATTDSTFTITFGATTWGEWVVGVWRATNGVGSIVGSAEYHTAAGYVTACPDASYSPTSGNLNIWGYAGQNSSVGGTATSFSGTAPSALSNFIQQGITGNGGGVGMGWQTTGSAPGGATANQAVDPTDFALEVSEAAPAGYTGTNGLLGTQAIPGRAQPGNSIPGQVAPTGLTVNAGLATGTGAAGSVTASVKISATLATGTGSAQSPGTSRTAGLATGAGTAQTPGITLTVNAGLATGTGTAQSPKATVAITAGLATGTGTGQSPTAGVAPNAGLATGTGTAQSPLDSLTITAGLATGSGTGQSPTATLVVNAGLATGTGTAFGPTIPAGAIAAGLATGTGTAQSPTVTLTVNAGLATGTGSAAQPGIALTAGLATGTGTAQPPVTTLTVNATLATGTGTAQSPHSTAAIPAGLATGTGTAQSPADSLTVNATLAHGTGTAQSPLNTLTVTAGLASGTGTAQSPKVIFTVNAGLAAGTGTALNVSTPTRRNVDYTGSTLTSPNTLGATISIATLDGTLSVVVNTLGGTATVNTNTLGGTLSIATLDGTASVTSDTLTGILSAVNALGGTEVTDKMQEVDITLNEFNDATVTFQIKNNGSPMDITGMTVNALFKKLRGDLDSAGTTVHYSSGGGSPAITINTPSTGSCTLAVPDTDVIFPNWTFYRIDVVNGTVTTTAIFGVVTITQL